MISAAFGYVASLLLAISLLVNNELKFRWFNMGGQLFFIAYGILIKAFPILLTNTILLSINVFYLFRAFDLMEFKPDEKIIQKFLKFYQKDIAAFFPEFKLSGSDNDIRFIVLRDMVIANIFIAEITTEGTAYVKLNYTVPKYRDYKVGTFIFEKEKDYLISKGIKNIMYEEVRNKSHENFLKRMRFTDIPDSKGKVLSLAKEA
jgi:hypothetical protein